MWGSSPECDPDGPNVARATYVLPGAGSSHATDATDRENNRRRGALRPDLPAPEGSHMHLARVLGLAFLVMVGTTACQTTMFSDPMGVKRDFEEIQGKFTKFIRWGAIDEASIFVVDEQRDAFLELAPEINDMRFTDYEVIRLDYAEDDQSATANVRYTGYRLSMPIEKSFRVDQEWTRDEETGAWTVSLNVDELRSALLGVPAKAAIR